MTLLILQARPFPAPKWWPREVVVHPRGSARRAARKPQPAWVTVHPDGTGWTAGEDASQAFAPKSPVGAVANIVWDWEDQNAEKGRSWAFRLRPVRVQAEPEEAPAKPKAPRKPAKGPRPARKR